MKGTGNRGAGGWEGYQSDDWEVSEELSPDPFSEEEHSKLHARRFSRPQNSQKINKRDIPQNQEHDGDSFI